MRRLGEAVRLRCTATGRYVGDVNGFAIGMFVSAQDNDLTLDVVDPDGTPYEGLPMPSDEAIEGASIALRYKPRAP